MYPWLESIKVKNGKLHNLAFHQNRVNQTFEQQYPEHKPLLLKNLVKNCPSDKIYKCRFLYEEQRFSYSFVEYSQQKITKMKCIDIGDFSYDFKASERSFFERLHIDNPGYDDFILIKNGFVTDASYANLVFVNDETFDTPASPLLYGIQRQKLLLQGQLKMTDIRVEDIRNYDSVFLINAMLGVDGWKERSILTSQIELINA